MYQHHQLPLGQTWHLKTFLIWAAASLLVLGSWYVPVIRGAWDALDEAVFYNLNATVAWPGYAEFWAYTGERKFDTLAASIVLAIYSLYVWRLGPERRRHAIAYGGILSVSLLVIIALQREIIETTRFTPSLMLEPFNSIREFVPWSRAKESSETSFPSDHSTVMMIITVFWWRFGGWRLGLVAAILTVAFSMPRLAAGAHWATDVLVGGGFTTLLSMALLLGTPLGLWMHRPAFWATNKTCDLLAKFFPALFKSKGTNSNGNNQAG